MKTPIVIACLLFACTCLAQNTFEGTIKWSMKMEITDPAMKAKMEEGQKQMNDPATQAKMKEMEKQMSDPQFKAMMDANPQMKAQMEKVMKMSQSGDMSSVMPSAFTLKLQGNNSLTHMEGGMITLATAREQPIRLLESGPAGGAIFAAASSSSSICAQNMRSGTAAPMPGEKAACKLRCT